MGKLSQLRALERPAGLSLWKEADLLSPFILARENEAQYGETSGKTDFENKIFSLEKTRMQILQPVCGNSEVQVMGFQILWMQLADLRTG